MSGDDESAILAAARTIETSLWRDSRLSRFQGELENLYFALINPIKRPQVGSKFRALRFIRSRFARHEILVLSAILAEQSNAHLHANVRVRSKRNFPDRGQNQRDGEREFRAYQLADSIYRQMDNGKSLDQAVEQCPVRQRQNLSNDTVLAELKFFKRRAKARGFADPFAALNAALSGIDHPEELLSPEITIERLSRKGRPIKKR